MKLRKAKKDPVNTLFSQLRQRHFTTSAITGSPCGANDSPGVWPTWCCLVLGPIFSHLSGMGGISNHPIGRFMAIRFMMVYAVYSGLFIVDLHQDFLIISCQFWPMQSPLVPTSNFRTWERTLYPTEDWWPRASELASPSKSKEYLGPFSFSVMYGSMIKVKTCMSKDSLEPQSHPPLEVLFGYVRPKQ